MKKALLFFVLSFCFVEFIFSQIISPFSRKVENCVFPDGKVADAYVFFKADYAVRWQDEQWKSYPSNSPLDPYLKAFKEEDAQRSNVTISPISYYMPKDFGQLAQYLTLDSAVMAVYEDSEGVYYLMISPPKYHIRTGLDRMTALRHTGQLVYKTAYVPKKGYNPVLPVRLNPAKTNQIDTTKLPDSTRNFTPSTTITENSAYYYDSNLAYQLQWLAVRIACIGKYDMAYTGDFRAKNPIDNYTTSNIKSYLARSGSATRGTVTFEGICFDYADFAYQELLKNKSSYSNVRAFWMVGTFKDSNDIITYRIANAGENSTMTINGTSVVVYSHERLRAHGDATNHAWIWVQSNDGTIYWLDPTWTDNAGHPVYGIVRNGREEVLTPLKDLCIK